MNKRKKPINGLLILTIMAAALWYSGYINENQYINKQIEVFSHIGQKASEKIIRKSVDPRTDTYSPR